VIAEVSDGVLIDVKVIPRAGRTGIAGTRADALLIRLAAAPVSGAANGALIALLAHLLDIPKSRIAIVAGDTSRNKRVKVSGVSVSTVRARLLSDERK
jgi:uncharacterized protein (TIGR00251 family)